VWLTYCLVPLLIDQSPSKCHVHSLKITRYKATFVMGNSPVQCQIHADPLTNWWLTYTFCHLHFGGPHPKIEPLARPSLLLFALKLTSYSRCEAALRGQGFPGTFFSRYQLFKPIWNCIISYIMNYWKNLAVGRSHWSKGGLPMTRRSPLAIYILCMLKQAELP